MFGTLAGCVDWLLGVVAPRRCALCAAPAAAAWPELFCGTCGSALPGPPCSRQVGGVSVIAPSAYASPLSDAVKMLKYSGRTDLALPLGRLIAAELARAGLDGDELFVPVPLHPRRVAARGYNQAALLARASARSLRMFQRGTRFSVAPLALQRVVDTHQQAHLERRGRALNVRSAFRVRAGRSVAGRSLVLVDDVVTTGETALACIEPLRASGARVVLVAAVCMALGQPPSSESEV